MKIRGIITIHGGKYYLAKDIINLFPDNYQKMAYVEPFGGCANVLLQKDQSDIEIYNDLNENLVNLFNQIRYNPDEFLRCLNLTPYSEKIFKDASIAEVEQNDLERAINYYIKMRMSIGGIGKSFSFSKKRSRNGMSQSVSAWLSSIDDNLPLVIDRFSRVQIFNRSAEQIIKMYDQENTLIYCDPPYFSSTRKSPNVYMYEMTDDGHEDFLKTITRCQFPYRIISGYDCELYNDYLHKWRKVDISLVCRAGKNSNPSQRTETIWLNY